MQVLQQSPHAEVARVVDGGLGPQGLPILVVLFDLGIAQRTRVTVCAFTPVRAGEQSGARWLFTQEQRRVGVNRFKCCNAVAILVTISGLAVFPTSVVADGETFDGDYYAKCLLDRVKPNMDAAATAAIRQACHRLSIPKKCRDITDDGSKFFNPRAMCLEECKEASYFERKFGACSLG